MLNKRLGFIGGGRITNIFLGGLKRSGGFTPNFGQIVVSDSNVENLNKLKELYPEISVTTNDNKQAALMDIVFLAVHPQAINSVVDDIKSCLNDNTLLISLAPKFTISKLSESLGGFQKIARMIPNAPSIINCGYNPICYSNALSISEKNIIKDIVGLLGKCPEVAEEKLEAYAILTAMGPTYLWFQLYELNDLGKSFGLNEQEVKEGIKEMVVGTVMTMFDSNLPASAVIDLIPVKPLGDDEEYIKSAYRTKLEKLYQKLKV
ncbi:MAG: NAD(P)-binding domain-containing protein [Thermoanaerobaculaceae bacterium]|nr:NAD(P)-binding domain-containing protein [Thermoanaerobaculaceae bacterium]